jgi:hypothetical protein
MRLRTGSIDLWLRIETSGGTSCEDVSEPLTSISVGEFREQLELFVNYFHTQYLSPSAIICLTLIYLWLYSPLLGLGRFSSF